MVCALPLAVRLKTASGDKHVTRDLRDRRRPVRARAGTEWCGIVGAAALI
jgi:hypothetical protein